ncbi:hypothetical protein [Zavarzinella formosa]|uniref:hypothetical protein n=1 Tax=Zavarzinella formosa TaxID=360055 RepID=UPI0002D43E28|nr:hypothetical protein [Zavarzinella formosa]
MTSSSFILELSAIADEALFRTNPVWCLEKLLKRWEQDDATRIRLSARLSALLEALPTLGFFLPPDSISNWARRHGPLSIREGAKNQSPPAPGVVGVIVDAGCQETWVVPLQAERSAAWEVDPTLPFRPGGILQDLFIKFLHTLGLPSLEGVPERFAFKITDSLGRRSDGPSMHVAGLLAVIREANARPQELDRVCAVVEPQADRLISVGGVKRKLDAFLREFGPGTLLVRAKSSDEAREYDCRFDEVWEVDSVPDLAKRCEERQWLRIFLDDQPLTTIDADAVTARIRRLEEIEHRYKEALDLACRTERCGFSAGVPMRLRSKVRQWMTDLNRHLGFYQRSAELAEESCRRTRSSQAFSYEDQARADVDHAAALYAPHRFDEILRILGVWQDRLKSDPRLVTPSARVMIFNTLGRSLIALGRSGWEEMFRQSEEILEEFEPTDLPRTWCYMAQGCLRNGRLGDAEDYLCRIESHPGVNKMSRRICRVAKADAARRRGELWIDPEMERAVVSREVGHPFGFYFQATARQSGRDAADSLARFHRSGEFFAQGAPDGDEQNIQRFLAECVRLAQAAWEDNQRRWDESTEAIAKYLSSNGFSGHYRNCLPEAGSIPSRSAVETLLDRVPFF